MREIVKNFRSVLTLALIVCASRDGAAQTRIAFPQPVPGATGSAPMVPVQPFSGGFTSPAVSGGSVLGQPVFDPYAAANSAPTIFGPPTATPYGTVPAPATSSPWGGLFGQPQPQPQFTPPATGQPVFGQTPFGSAPAPRPWANVPQPSANAPWFGNQPPLGTQPAPGVGAAPGWGQPYPTYPGASPYPNAYPSQSPSALFPDGFNWWTPGEQQEPLRLFQNLRMRHTWLAGDDDGRDMDINDTEIATTMQFPNALGLGQPFMVSPNFAFHQWDGPQPPITIGMPPRAYSAYLEAAYKTDPTKTFGGDITASIGVFSDFSAVTTRSIRIQGLGYVWAQVTPTVKLKVGANYIDRVDLSLLPAIGFLWEPDQQTKLDIFFPKPKLARYFSTLGNTDIWIYIAGEYGGGSWTVKHNGVSDQVDINDIRVMGGFEWVSQSGWQGMFEVGWVTHRELVFYVHPNDNLRLTDTYMLRVGLTY